MTRGKRIPPELVLAMYRRYDALKSTRQVAKEFGRTHSYISKVFRTYDRLSGEPLNPKRAGASRKLTKEQDDLLYGYFKTHPTAPWKDAEASVFPNGALPRLGRATIHRRMQEYKERRRRENIAIKKGIPLDEVDKPKKKAKKTTKTPVAAADVPVRVGETPAPAVQAVQPFMHFSDFTYTMVSEERFIWPQIVLFGDDHFLNCFATGCIGSLLAAQFQCPQTKQCDILNRSFEGHTTKAAIAPSRRFIPSLIAPDIAAVVILFGTSDACQTSQTGPVPVEEYSRNLGELVELFAKQGIPANRIILISPPPSNQEAWADHCTRKKMLTQLARSNVTLYKYKVAVHDVALQHGAQFVDLYGEMMEHPEWKTLFTDGVHLNAFGSSVFVRLLGPAVSGLLRQEGYLSRCPGIPGEFEALL